MDRYEFIEKLRQALVGRVDDSVVEDTVRYYDSYIATEVAGGSAESVVLASLGDPRLIARSVVDAYSSRAEGTDASEEYGGERYTQEEPSDARSMIPVGLQLPAAARLGIGIAIVVLVLALAARVLVWAAPTLITVALVIFVVRKLRDILK